MNVLSLTYRDHFIQFSNELTYRSSDEKNFPWNWNWSDTKKLFKKELNIAFDIFIELKKNKTCISLKKFFFSIYLGVSVPNLNIYESLPSNTP